MKSEADVKKAIKEILKQYPYLHYVMPSASQYGVVGTHDFLIWQRGLGWSIEAKFGSNKPTPMQKRFAVKLYAAGGVSLCITETNLHLVTEVANWINMHKTLPLHLNQDFTKL